MDLDINATISSTTATSITITWSPITAAQHYNVECSSEILGSNLGPTETHSVSLTVANSSTRAVVHHLVPSESYNCCVSAHPFINAAQSCDKSVTLDLSGVSAAVAGGIGAVVALITVLIVFAVMVPVVLCVLQCRRHRSVK